MFDSAKKYCLSRYAFLRRVGDVLVVESPVMGRQSKTVNSSVLLFFLRFASPTKPIDVLSACSSEQQATLVAFLEWCVANHLFVEVLPDGRTTEDIGPLAHWEFHDLLFHSASRLGRNLGKIGGTYRLNGVVPPEPHARPRYSHASYMPLPEPDLATLMENDVPFTRALEQRRSKRTTSQLTIDALGHFLYRTCRVVHTSTHEGESLVTKLYPSGGSLHPLEIYFVNHSCVGMERGLYHYDPQSHSAAKLRVFDTEIAQLLDAAATSSALEGYPAVLFEICARFRRSAWKYEGISYRLILAELGALYQTMYLVASAMRLSPCAIGSGDSDYLASLLSSDYYLESAIGEFMLSGPMAEPTGLEPQG
jgi:SagB-type dehydrogenase family enzyme